MTNNEDIRWLQRFNNFKKALNQLESAVTLSKQRDLSDLEEQGLIQSFEYTYELAWNVLKDFLKYQGSENIFGSRDSIREAFKRELIKDGESWMEMFKDRNKTTHTYNQDTADEIVEAIKNRYYHLLKELEKTMGGLKGKD